MKRILVISTLLCAASLVHAGERKFQPRGMLTFEQMDANRDGKVTLEEFKAAQAKMAQDRFKRLDGDDNGAVSQDEYTGAAKRLSDVNPDLAAKMKKFIPDFTAMDKDATGSLNLDEFATGMTHAAMERFEKADRNADDVITRDEADQALAMLKERGAAEAEKPGRKPEKSPK